MLSELKEMAFKDKVVLSDIKKYSDLYIRSLNVHIDINLDKGWFYITDLENALDKGKYCNYFEVLFYDYTGDFLEYLRKNNIVSFIQGIIKDYKSVKIEGVKINLFNENSKIYGRKSYKVFTPFKDFSSVKLVKNITKTHVWKYLLSGRVKYVEHVSNEYRWSHEEYFKKGERIPEYYLARKIIENNSHKSREWHIFDIEHTKNEVIIDLHLDGDLEINKVVVDKSKFKR